MEFIAKPHRTSEVPAIRKISKAAQFGHLEFILVDGITVAVQQTITLGALAKHSLNR